MVNINNSRLTTDLQELLKRDFEQKVSYLPDSFYLEQEKMLEIFNKRIFLEKVIEETIAFNRKLDWDKSSDKLHLVTSAEELINIFKLRSDVYRNYGYNKEFPDEIEGLSFDKFDTHSAIVYYKNNSNIISGAIRLILNSNNKKLPTEDKISLDSLKSNGSTIGEISKLVVNTKRGLALEFKYLMRGVYDIFSSNDISNIISAIKTSDLKLYDKMGNIKVIHELDSYGKIQEPFSVITYDVNSVSNFSKKAILK